ncbi:MAG: YegS/Rv2252/BmrU family lipid kinase [Clostridia bacterium]|nr:YegS/Rv2252/BmrU family lipid kinase [Clostridia bacterium]
MKKLLFVYNPTSGSSEGIVRKLPKILKIFAAAGYQTDLYPTKAPRDGFEKIRADGANYARVVTAGGDGMLNELVNAVMDFDEPIVTGYIPAGTVNDFATTHTIPKKVLKAAKIAVSDNLQSVDIGQFNDRYFSYVAATGFGTRASCSTDSKAKKQWKFLAYAAEAMKEFNKDALKAVSRKMKIVADGVTLEGEFVFAAVSNAFSIAGMRNLTDKRCVLDDGMLEGLFIPFPENFKKWGDILGAFLSRDYYNSNLTYIKAKRFEIHSESALWTLDGEKGGEHETTVITAKRKALRMAMPKTHRTFLFRKPKK